MPFLNHDRRPSIRHPQGHPVAVRATFNVLGDLRPRSFYFEDDNQEAFRYKVAAIKNIKDGYMTKEFICCYDAYGLRNDIVLCFDIVNCRWVIG
jgi:hypothetical protein